jgi:hypothetical protein
MCARARVYRKDISGLKSSPPHSIYTLRRVDTNEMLRAQIGVCQHQAAAAERMQTLLICIIIRAINN